MRSVLGATAIAIGLGSVAVAAIPGSDGMVKGCYATSSGLLLGIPYSKGDLRVVDAAEACRSYEQQLTWNQQGPPGAPGSALGYARLLPTQGKVNDALDRALSSGVAGATIARAGSHVTGATTVRYTDYCIVTEFTPHNIVVTPDFVDDDSDDIATAEATLGRGRDKAGAPICPDGTSAFVQIRKSDVDRVWANGAWVTFN